ncbi:MAG: YihY/virulence factor BrkB family protein [Candidatus Omnitrophica bacterium]|nr:YihY/virulence factor BrkB family protein [Candidatus Omnitrophota bacterium]
MIKKTISFLTHDVWRIRVKTLSRSQSFFIQQLRVILLSLRGFNEDKCQLRASALTYYSLLSIVPVAAMAFGIAKGFGFDKMLEDQISERFANYGDVITQIITFARSMLDNTKGGLVAGIGVVLLFWAVIKVLGNIEKSFNDIWGLKQARSLARKFSDYLSIMLICPILLIASGSVTVFITTQVTEILARFSVLGMFSPLIFFLLKLLPYCMVWILFAFIYLFMPNTKVNIVSALIGGVVAGTAYQVVQWVYITFQVGMSKYNAIYGSFAALPMFLVWLQISWLVMLFGAELSFAHQNVDMYEFEPDCLKASVVFKRLLSLRIVHLLVQGFTRGNMPLTTNQIVHELEIPIRLARQLLYDLVQSRVLSEVKVDGDREIAYQPARDIGTMSIKYVIDALERNGVEDIPIAYTEEVGKLRACLDDFSETLKQSPSNRLLIDI